MSKRLSGINPLSYMGVEPYVPPAMHQNGRAPSNNDSAGYNLGDFWLEVPPGYVGPEKLYVLISLSAGQATWVQLYPAGGGSSIQFETDSGTVNPALGIVNVLGDGLKINTTGSGNTITINSDSDVANEYVTDSGTAIPSSNELEVFGGSNINTSGVNNTVTINLNNNVSIPGTLDVSGDTTLNSDVTITPFSEGVVQSNNSGLLSSSSGNNGQILIGSTGGAPAWANITSLGGTVSITNGSNTINIESEGGGGGGTGTTCAFLLYQDANVLTRSATPVAEYQGLGSFLQMQTKFDIGNNCTPGDGLGTPATFTAPVSGKYYLNLTITYNGQPASGAIAYRSTRIRTSSGDYYFQPSVLASATDFSENTNTYSLCVDMTAGDTATFEIEVPSSAVPRINIIGSPLVDGLVTWFSGFLIGSAGATMECSFLGYQLTNQNMTVLGTATPYLLGQEQALVTKFDVGNGFFPGDGAGSEATFTAPVTGKYFIQMAAQVSPAPTFSFVQNPRISIVTPTCNYTNRIFGYTSTINTNQSSPEVSSVVDLNAGDVVTFSVLAEGFSGGNVRLDGNAPTGGTFHGLVTWCSGFLIGAGGGGGGGTIVSRFTASDTWTKSAGTQYVEVYVICAGGGGASGSLSASNQTGNGGGGGGSWGSLYFEGPAFCFDSSHTVTVGAGGAGGASISTPTTSGALGANGGLSSFADMTTRIAGNPGSLRNGGGSGSAIEGSSYPGYYGDIGLDRGSYCNGNFFYVGPQFMSAGNGGALQNSFIGKNGLSRSLTSSNTQGTVGAYLAAGTGGGGGGKDTSGNAFSGGNGGSITKLGSGSVAVSGGAGGVEGGTLDGGNGSAGLQAVGVLNFGAGGGGGGNQALGVRGGNGGDGGFPGGAGGGGGAGINGSSSGAGGDGANGIVIVIEYL